MEVYEKENVVLMVIAFFITFLWYRIEQGISNTISQKEEMICFTKALLFGAVWLLLQPLPAGAASAGVPDENEFILTPRAHRIYDRALKTPKALLALIQKFMEHLDMSGFDFGEQISGIDRQYWGVFSRRHGVGGHEDLVFQEYEPYCRSCPINFATEGNLEEPAAYSTDNFKIDVDNNNLVDLSLYFRPSSDKLSDMYFKVTPALVRDFLGEPTRLYVTSPWKGGYTVGSYYLDYIYKFSGYELSLSFLAPGDDNPGLEYEHMNHTKEQLRAERQWRKKFANHKDFLAVSLRLSFMKE